MTTDSPDYKVQLRSAQALFRAKEQTRAFEIARNLHETYPNAEGVATFYSATARFINGMVRKHIRHENHELTIYYARMLLEDATFQETACNALLGAARAGLAPSDRVDLLYPICRTKLDLEQYWREIALCIPYLRAEDMNIAIGFDVLTLLPGHSVALDGLAGLIAQQTALPTAPSDMPQVTE